MSDTEPDIFAPFARGKTSRRAKLPDKVSAKVKLRLKKTKAWFRAKRKWRKKYRAYLRSPEWKAKRQERLKLSKGLCEYCSAPAEQVHHLTYERIFNEDIADLRSICIPCHKLQHPGKKFRKFGKKKKKAKRSRPKPFTGTFFVEF